MRDIVAEQFEKWTVIAYVGRNGKCERLFSCECECGTIRTHTFSTLTRGRTTQCKACRMKSINIVESQVGKTFGSWSVIGTQKHPNRNAWVCICRCICGTQKIITEERLRTKRTTQCRKCRLKI